MRKGQYTQGLAILLRNAVPLRAIEEQLKDFEVVKRIEARAKRGPTVIVAYRPDVNGYVAIDVVDQPWPDQMGGAKADLEVFGAWALGHFGPGAWPGGLERACQHSWGWPDGGALQHQAFIRIRSSYVFGTDDNAPLWPEDYRPLEELKFATRMAGELIRLPEAICFFNPNGECALSPSEFFDTLSYHASANLMPLGLWSNVRFFRLEGTNPEWCLMDTVGMSQLDAPDHEAFFQLDAYDTGQIGNFLRNASAYIVERGPIIRNGDTMDGPGNIWWQGFNVKQGHVVPPRRVVRWLPLDGRDPPAELAEVSMESQPAVPIKRPTRV
jgi:hypothetical protein